MCTPGPVWPIPASGMFDTIRVRILKPDIIITDCIETDTITINDPPTNGIDGVNKNYVDAKSFKESARVSTIIAGSLASDFEAGDTVDGVTLLTGDRILIKNQADASENGIYTVNDSGSPTRADDAQTTMEASGSAIVIQEGTINQDTFWVCDTSPSVNFGSSISFIQIVGSGTPGGPVNSVQFNNSGNFGGSTNLLWDGSTLTVNGTTNTDTLQLDDGSGNTISITSPSLTSDYSLVLPNSDGDSNQVLSTNGSGNLSWVSLNTNYTRTEVNSGTYNVLDSDDIIAVLFTPTGTVTINLPNITGLKQYTIVDEGGNAGTNNITINADASDTIIGQTSFTINNDYNSISIYSDGTSGWFIR